jgi:hypothetical protein
MAIPKNDGERFDYITAAINVLNGKVEALIVLLSVTPAVTDADFDKAIALVKEVRVVKEEFRLAHGVVAHHAPVVANETIQKIKAGG